MQMSDTKASKSALSSIDVPCFASAVPIVYQNHPGYLAYLDIIERNVSLYKSMQQNKKWHVIKSIIAELQEQGREFQFLGKDGLWVEYNTTQAQNRTTDLMRRFVRYHDDGVPLSEKDIPVFASTVPATLHNHPGYVAYLDLVQSYVDAYSTAKPNHKVLVLRDVLDKMNENGMKFVKMDATSNMWRDYEEKETVILEKIRTLIKMYSKVNAEEVEYANRSHLNDSHIEDEASDNEEQRYTPAAASRKIKIPNIISHNSNDEQESDTSVSSDTDTVGSDDDEDANKSTQVAAATKPINFHKKRNVIAIAQQQHTGKRLPSMKKARIESNDSANDESSNEEQEEASPILQFNSSLCQIIQMEVQRQLKRSSVIKKLESKIKKLEQEAILHNQQKVKMEERIEVLQLQIEAFQQEIGFQD